MRSSLVGEGAPLSASSVARLKAQWQVEYEAWRRRDSWVLEVVYCWADGVYVKAGLEDAKAALLVVIGARADGHKAVLAIESGQRESRESWAGVLRDLKARGLPAPGVLVAERTFRRLNAPRLLVAVAAGARYVDGIAVRTDSERVAA